MNQMAMRDHIKPTSEHTPVVVVNSNVTVKKGHQEQNQGNHAASDELVKHYFARCGHITRTR